MKKWIFSLLFMAFCPLSLMAAQPRFPNPSSPGQAWQNDLDLLDQIRAISSVSVSTNITFGSDISTTCTTGLSVTPDGDGDIWVTANACWDGTNWYRASTTTYSFGLELIGSGNFPGESEPGAALWVAQPGTNPIGTTFGAVGGWELGWDVTAFRDMVMGGYGIEVDGHGTTPYGRFLHTPNAISASTFTGVARNIYADFSGCDNSNSPSWAGGITGDSYSIYRSSNCSPVNFQNYVSVSSNGYVSQAQQPGFLAYNSGTDSNVTGNNTTVTVDYDTEVYDTTNSFSADTFTAPITGKYLLTGSAYLTDTATGNKCEIRLVTSNATYANETWPVSTIYLEITKIVDMDIGDTASIQVNCSGGALAVDINASTTVGSSRATSFSGTLLN